MLGKRGHPGQTASKSIAAVISIALLCMTASTPALSQVWGDPGDDQTTSADSRDRYEAERRRQEQLRLERERRAQEKLRFETERLRQENERHKQEQLILENERLRQENERHEREQLLLELQAQERVRAERAALQVQASEADQDSGPDVYEQLRMIDQLRDDGIVTDDEFDRLKAKILD